MWHIEKLINGQWVPERQRLGEEIKRTFYSSYKEAERIFHILYGSMKPEGNFRIVDWR